MLRPIQVNGEPLNVRQEGDLDDGNYVAGDLLGPGQRNYTSNYGCGQETDNWRARSNAAPTTIERRKHY